MPFLSVALTRNVFAFYDLGDDLYHGMEELIFRIVLRYSVEADPLFPHVDERRCMDLPATRNL
jgi:hypothetical protein